MFPNGVQPRQLHSWAFSLGLWVFHTSLPEGQAWREGLEIALSQDVFVASRFICVISECESTLRGKLNSDLETSIEVLCMPGYKKRSRSSPGLWGVVDKCGFNRRTLRTPDSTQDSNAHLQPWVNCSVHKRDGEGLGCMLVLHCYGLMSADQKRDSTLPSLLFLYVAVSLAVTAWMTNKWGLVYNCFAVDLTYMVYKTGWT